MNLKGVENPLKAFKKSIKSLQNKFLEIFRVEKSFRIKIFLFQHQTEIAINLIKNGIDDDPSSLALRM